jgi:hypothetical protein
MISATKLDQAQVELKQAQVELDQVARIRNLVRGDLSKLDAQITFYGIKQEAHLQNCAFLEMLLARPELNTSLTNFSNPAHCGKLENIIRIKVGYGSDYSTLAVAVTKWKDAIARRASKIAQLQTARDGLLTDPATVIAQLDQEYLQAQNVYKLAQEKEDILRREHIKADLIRVDSVRRDPSFGCHSCIFGWCDIHNGPRRGGRS